MSKFHSLVVKEVTKQTSDSVSINFEIPESLKSDYKFIQGQYITIEKEINGNKIRRAYSIWKAPFQNELSVLVKQVENGLFSTYANSVLKEGDILDVMVPQGVFYPNLSSNNKKHYNLFAAGSGITPIISIAKEILHQEENSTVDLFYVNKSSDSVIFQKELEELSANYEGKMNVYNFYSRVKQSDKLFYGRIDKDKMKKITRKKVLKLTGDFFMCGPEQMILDIKQFLDKNKIEKERIHFELFTTSEPVNNQSNVSGIESAKVFLTIDDDDFEYDYKISDSDSLLDAGISNGLDLPYSCKGGVCCTCKAKVLEGEAKMKINYALSEEEVEEGYILTCQSHPTTPTLKVSFDD